MLCDSNIVIYAADPNDTRCLPFAAHEDAVIAAVSRIGRTRLHEIVASLAEIPLTEAVIQQAIALRRAKKMSLADAVIAATASAHALPLVTRNVDDFKHIGGLRLINPFDDA